MNTSLRSFGPVHFVPGGNRGRYPCSNSVYVEGAGVLIDAGADGAIYRELLAGPGVQEVWLSHWHEDHLTHLDLFAGLPLSMMAADAPALAGIGTGTADACTSTARTSTRSSALRRRASSAAT